MGHGAIGAVNDETDGELDSGTDTPADVECVQKFIPASYFRGGGIPHLYRRADVGFHGLIIHLWIRPSDLQDSD